jgi:hypothetical protein
MMLLARCLSDGIASHCPETARGLRVYGEGEIGGPDPAAPVGVPVQSASDDAPDPAPDDAVVMVDDTIVASIVDQADDLGLLGTLQAAASHAAGHDVGDCSTKETAWTAVASLTAIDAQKVCRWLDRKAAAHAAETQPATEPAEPRTDPVTFDDVLTTEAA